MNISHKKRAMAYEIAANRVSQAIYNDIPPFFRRTDMWWAFKQSLELKWLYRLIFYYRCRAKHYKWYLESINNLPYTNFDWLIELLDNVG